MRKVNNNIEISKAQSKAVSKTEKASTAEPSFGGEEEFAEVKDFSNPTEILGRSQIKKSDNLKTDIAFCCSNAKTVTKADKLFDISYKGLKDSEALDAYEKACSIATCEETKDILSK